MSRKGKLLYDNAFCESFMKMLKYDQVHSPFEYRDSAEVRVSIEHFLETVVNWKRLHSRLVPPRRTSKAVSGG